MMCVECIRCEFGHEQHNQTLDRGPSQWMADHVPALGGRETKWASKIW